MPFTTITPTQVREQLLARQEIALIDLREEAPYALSHPLFAVNMPLGRIEADAWVRIPRLSTLVVLLDDGQGLVHAAALIFQRLGYTEIRLLDTCLNADGKPSGIAAWAAAKGELFQDVNVPSKSFGELVESVRHTPSLSAQEVLAMQQAGADMVVLDARRFDEYATMNIPGGISVPGAELVLRARTLAPNPSTHIVVNCAGRTRSIIGTQSLVNAGIPNPVTALRNGTIGWTLAGQALQRGANRRFTEVPPALRADAAARAHGVAERAGVRSISAQELKAFQAESSRTSYCFDVRTPEEYEAGHLPGFWSTPGGQLVQETDFHAAVRGARIVLFDTDGVRANMTASWLAQMAWEVYVLAPTDPGELSETGPARFPIPPHDGRDALVSVETLQQWQSDQAVNTQVLDFSASAAYVKAHIPGAWFVLRSDLVAALERIAPADRYVLTDSCARLARHAFAALSALTDKPVYLLDGGNSAWRQAGLTMASGEAQLASPRIDRYRRPYEGTDAPAEAMQAYLDWEFGLVEQLGRDGTHGFRVV